MSGQLGTAIMFVSLVAIALAANQAEEQSQFRGTSREIASQTTPNTKPPLKGRQASVLKHTQKLHGPLSVKVELVGAPPTKIGDTFVLRGSIRATKPISGADYSWSIPAGLVLITGQTSGHLDYVGPTQPAVMLITLRKARAVNIQVHLLAASSQGQSRFGDSAQYNTDLQDQIDAQKEQLKRDTAAEAGKLKIMH